MSKPELRVPAPENFPQFENLFAQTGVATFKESMAAKQKLLAEMAKEKDGEGRRARMVLAALDQAMILVQRVEQAATSAQATR